MAIDRTPLCAQVRMEILEKMRTGQVQPGDPINEIQLAKELGVSRTPLREALIKLESMGQIASIPGKGFHYRKFSAKEFREITPIIVELEGLALDLSPKDELIKLSKELIRQAKAFKQEDAEYQLITSKDDMWHELMISACPNAVLVDLITRVRQTLHQYESLLVTEKVVVHRVAAEHQKIAEALSKGDLTAAKKALRENWFNSVDRILARSDITDLLDSI